MTSEKKRYILAFSRIEYSDKKKHILKKVVKGRERKAEGEKGGGRARRRESKREEIA